jgi:D-tyrosyl-tRNA(Tyr) deacylase
MRVVLQRVSGASVTVDGAVVGAIERGYLLLVGFTQGDGDAEVEWMADKVSGLRVFGDDDGRLNRDLHDVGGAVLVVSQFTVYADCSKGRRPSLVRAAPPDAAEALYHSFADALRHRRLTVHTGVFRAVMEVALVNDGPVTLLLER